jgi:hypothetical protein
MSKKLAIVLAFAGAVICGGGFVPPPAHAQSVARSGQSYAQGLLWKVERAGSQPSYVFGTMHVSDPRAIALPAPVRQTFDAATIFAMEILLDPQNMLTLATRMIYLDGRDLPTVIGRELYEKVAALAPTLGVPPQLLTRFKPWAVALLLMTPSTDGENILDNRLYRMALEQKKAVHQLETADEQVDALEGANERDQIALLRAAVADHDRVPERTQRLVDAYVRGDLAALSRIGDEDAASDPEMKRLNETFMKRLLDDRNVRMAERMEQHLKSGRAFIAVGALHLYGDRGVLGRLASRGYRVSRVY